MEARVGEAVAEALFGECQKMSAVVPKETESRIGRLAVRKGWVKDEEITRLLKVQGSMSMSGIRQRLGQMMILHGIITDDQLEELLKWQSQIRKAGPDPQNPAAQAG